MASPPRFLAGLLRASSRAYAAAAVERLARTLPQTMAQGLPAEFADPIDDVQVRILHLAESVGVDRPALLEHAMAWYKVALHHRGVPDEYLPASLGAIRDSLHDELPAHGRPLVERHLQRASGHLAAAPTEWPSSLTRQAPHGEVAARFLLAALEGRGDDAIALLRDAVAAGATVAELHDHVLTVAQRESGRMWLQGEITIADEHHASTVVDRALWSFHERLPRPAPDAPRVLVMGVGGNLHELGLRIVAQRLQLGGLAVHYLGTNMPATDVEHLLAEPRLDLVAIGSTMTLQLDALAHTIEQVRAQTPAGRRLPILVGGEPFGVVPDLHAVLGADAAATDAEGAVTAARRLVARTA